MLDGLSKRAIRLWDANTPITSNLECLEERDTMAWYEYAAVIVTCLTAISLVYSTLKTGISPMPSSLAARKAILTLSHDLNGPIYELGSGWGGLAAALSRAHPQRHVIGIELSWLPWLYATAIRKLVGPNNLEFKRGDFLNVDLSSAATIVCYLHPKGMDNLAKAHR